MRTARDLRLGAFDGAHNFIFFHSHSNSLIISLPANHVYPLSFTIPKVFLCYAHYYHTIYDARFFDGLNAVDFYQFVFV